MKMYILLVVISCLDYSYASVEESLDTCEISFTEEPTGLIFYELEATHWIKVDTITSKDYTFKYTANDKSIDEAIALLKDKFKPLIKDIDRVQMYSDVKRVMVRNQGLINTEESKICDNYYGMSVEGAWADGFSGQNVIVAVTDVGVNTNISEFKKNINNTLSFNYINGTTDVTPRFFHNYQDLSSPDHGNRCVSLIAGIKGNGICSSGIAYNASIAVVKTFEIIQVNKNHPIFEIKSNSTVMAKSLLHKIGIIDIYSNSWSFKDPFARLTAPMRSSLKQCAEKGRDGKGALLVFPTGPSINELMNNEYVITVGAVGKNKAIPEDYVITSAVLTSGLHDGSNITASYMVTTTIGNRCSTTFAGVSAATAQVAGMIALALQANPDLTREDVEDLTVYSSDYVTSNDDPTYRIENAADHKFHFVFGSGILNASKLVTAARKRTFHVKTVKQNLKASNISADGRMAVFCYDCGTDSNKISDCVGTIKKAQVEVIYKSSADHLSMTLKSPSGTTSLLQNLSSNGINTEGKTRKQILTSVHFWGEEGYGLRVFRLQSNGLKDEIVDNYLTLIGFSQEGGIANSSYSRDVKCETNRHNITESPIIANNKEKNNSTNVAIISVVLIIIVVSALAALINFFYKSKRIKKYSVKNEGFEMSDM